MLVESTPGATATPSRKLRLDVTDTIEDLAAEWSELATAGTALFGTPEFVTAWQATGGSRSALRIVTARDENGVLRIVVPLVLERRGPLRIVRFAGYGVADILGPVTRPEDVGLAIPVMERVLSEAVMDWDVFLGERLRAAVGWAAAPGMVVLRIESNPVVRLSDRPDWEAYLGSLPRRLRSELRHDHRILVERHGLEVRRCTDASTLDRDLGALFGLHALRFGKGSSFAPREAFHRRFAAIALEHGWLRLTVLELDGRPAAARYDFSHGGVHYAYNAGRDPAWSRLSVGLVLRAMTMRTALEEGAATYRFLRGGESYKHRFLATDDPLVTIARSRTWLGRRAVGLGLRLRHRRRVRHLLRALTSQPSRTTRP